MSNMGIKDEDFYLLALQFIDGLGPIKSNILLSHFNSAQNLFEAQKKDFSNLSTTISVNIIDQILHKSSYISAETEIEFCLKNNIQIVTFLSSNYPARLRYLVDKPLVLYQKGNIYPQIKKSLAIVGTRKSTDYGHKFLDNLFEELRNIENLSIISGLALGIDQKAHNLSVKHHIPTIAVMGIGLNKIYPTQNTRMAHNIIEAGGGWLTETSSQDKISQGVFPRRNRLIAGMCDALLIVETDVKGGAVITAHLANDYSKEVFALPGRTTDSSSRGCNDLIQKNIATLINSPYDIIEAMSWGTSSNKKIHPAIELNFESSSIQKLILDEIRKFPKIEFEKLLLQSNIDHSQLVESLLELELEGMIRTLPGNKYELI